MPFPSSGDLSNPGMEPESLALASAAAWEAPNKHLAVLCLVAQLCPILCNPVDCSLPGSSVYENSPGKNTGVDCHALLQGIFPTQGLNPGLSHCRWILYHLSHQGSPRILECVAIPSSGDLPDPGIKPGSPSLLADSFPVELPGKTVKVIMSY